MFETLSNELTYWADAGEVAQFWWRDDDAQSASNRLDDLLEISARYSTPLSLAVIPDGVQGSLIKSLTGHQPLTVLQHGFNHLNYAPADLRKMELGWHRPSEEILAQLKTGFECLQHSFSEQFVPVMVPPWNRIDEGVVGLLKESGFSGLSTLGPRVNHASTAGLKVVNVHVDIINWQQGRCFAGYEACEAQIVAHLSAKREGSVDASEPTGIMSHHRVHDAGCSEFLTSLFAFFRQQDTVEMLDAKSMFG